jgi:ankyrin repeat protein/tRNA A-37 threonylcarbamoyl transferase component Bud32
MNIFEVASRGRVSELESLLSSDASALDRQDSMGRTMLSHAASSNKVRAALFLISKGAKVDACDAQQRTPAHHAAQRYSGGGMVIWLWKKGADLEAQDQSGLTPLHWCDEKTKMALEKSGQSLLRVPTSTTSGSATWSLIDNLHQACVDGNVSQVAAMIEAAASSSSSSLSSSQQCLSVDSRLSASILHDVIETRSLEGKNALHMAVEGGHGECVRLLLEAGANPDAEEEYGNTPLILAVNYCRGDCPDIVALLAKHGANVRVRSMFGLVPLLIAAEKGLLNVVAYLVEHAGADILQRGSFGNTAAHYAVLNRQDRVAIYLHEHGADFALANNDGKSPYDLASRQLLVQLGRQVAADDDVDNESESGKRTLDDDDGGQAVRQGASSAYYEATLLTGRDELLIDFAQLTLQRSVGKGNFGEVFRAQWRKKRVVAVKKLHASLDGQLRYIDMIRNEIVLMTRLKHPCIIELCGACIVKPHVCLVLEWAERGNLRSLLHRSAPSLLPERMLLSFALSAAKAMAFAHSKSIYHRDLRSSNVLITDDWQAKVADWGLAYCASRRAAAQSQSHQAIGSLRWMAPEIYSGQGASATSDVYSYAFLLVEMITRDVPFAHLPPRQAATEAVERRARPTLGLAENSLWPRALIEQCWAHEAVDRPSFADIASQLENILGQQHGGDSSSSSPSSSSSSPSSSSSLVSIVVSPSQSK